ncbi:MAG: T9SS type A sorting domain-containing protein [Bacteroidota bacterium]
MKKLLLIATVLTQINLFSQTLPNGGFENWNTITYDEPASWNTGNPRDIPRLGIPSVTKVNGFSGFAVRIQNNVVGSDTSESYIINTNNPCSDPPQWTGGVPYSQQPTTITGQYRYNLLGNDSALLIVIFRKNGVHIGDNFIKIRGTGSQNTFTSFSFSVVCSGVPDTLIIAAASSNKKSGTPPTNGSFIEFDNLAFSGASQIIPGGDFDTWTSKSYEKPIGWETWGSGVSKSTNMYTGAYSIRLETVTEMCNNNNPNSSGITTGHLTKNSGPAGGQPYTNMVDTLCGYYKYASMGNDTANISINLLKNGSNVGGGWKQLVASGSYVYFEIPINAGTTPDTMRIDIQSSKWPTLLANIGSMLYIDNLFIKSQPTGIFENEISKSNVYSYPNPTKNLLYIKSEKDFSDQTLSIYDVIGNCVKSQQIISNTTLLQVDVTELSSGMYYYLINSNGGNSIRNKFIKE